MPAATTSPFSRYFPRVPITGPWALISIWITRAEQRAALAELDEERLRDIGVTRDQARREAAKPFWRG